MPPPRCHPFNKYFNRAPTRLGLVEEAGEHPNVVELLFRVCFKKKTKTFSPNIFHATQPHHAAPFLSDQNLRRRDRERERERKKKETEDEGVGEDRDGGGGGLGREG